MKSWYEKVPPGILTFAGGHFFSTAVFIHVVTWAVALVTAWIAYSSIHSSAQVSSEHKNCVLVYLFLTTFCPAAALFIAAFREDLLSDRYTKTIVDAYVFGVLFLMLVFSAQALHVAFAGEATVPMLIAVVFSSLGAGMMFAFHVEAKTAPR